jgi:hypothetical protein
MLPDNLQLIKDLRSLFIRRKGFVATERILDELEYMNPDRWSANSFYGKKLTAQRLGRILYTSFGIYSVRVGDSQRGYHAHQFVSLWGLLETNELLITEVKR